MLTIVGMGNVKGDLTARGRKAIKGAGLLVCRSFLTPLTKGLKRKGAVSYDEFFETATDFENLNQLICEDLIQKSQAANVVYCVQGDGFGDGAVQILADKNIEFEIIGGVSDLGSRVPVDGIAAYSAYTYMHSTPFIDTSFAFSLREIDNVLLAGEVKLALLEYYPPSTTCRYSYNNKTEEITLEHLDKQKRYNFSSSVFIPPLTAFNKTRYCFADLMQIMKRLTAADGCEWDKAQTHSSIRINLIEEAYEAVDAIDNNEIDAMIEETGDVLLQTVFHSDIAARCGEYTFGDVIDRLCTKLISRHTHIFGNNKATDASQALTFWESAKALEKNQSTLADGLNSIPAVFPALLKAEKAFKKAVKAGLKIDYETLSNAILTELNSQHFGSALFLCVALAALKKQDAEVELNAVCTKFIEALKTTKDLENVDFLKILD